MRVDPDGVMRAFAARWAPWFADAELAEMIAHVLAIRRVYRTDTPGEWLGLTEVECDTLGIETICFVENKPPRPKPPTRERAEATSTAPTSSRRAPRHPMQPATDEDRMCRDLIGTCVVARRLPSEGRRARMVAMVHGAVWPPHGQGRSTPTLNARIPTRHWWRTSASISTTSCVVKVRQSLRQRDQSARIASPNVS